MLRPTEMAKVSVLCSKKQLEPVIRELYRHKALHILEKSAEGMDIGKPLQNAPQLSEIILKIRSIASYLDIDLSQQPPRLKEGDTDFYNLGKTCRELSEVLTIKLKEKEALEGEKERISAELQKLRMIERLGLDISFFSEYKKIDFLVGTFKGPLPAIKKESALKVVDIDRETKLIAVFFRKEKKAEVESLFKSLLFSQIDVPRPNGLKLATLIEKVQSQFTLLESKIAQISSFLEKTKKEYQDFILFNEHFLKREIERADAPLKFASTKNITLIQGFVPKKQVPRLRDGLMKRTDGNILLREEKISHHDPVPTEMRNPALWQPYEFFLHLYTIPKNYELDPSFFMFWTFPLFFGYMLGDVGYGLVLLMLFMYLKKTMPEGKAIFSVLTYSAIISIAFGFLFGEFFGFEPYHIISRLHDHTLLFGNNIHIVLFYALIMGAIHINLSLIIGFINLLHHHVFAAAFKERLSWILLEIGLVLGLAGPGWGIPSLVGWALFAFSIIPIYMAEGIFGLIEIPGLFSNMLSYARLMAVGLASVGLAVVINELVAGLTAGGSILGWIMAIIVFAFGHALNIALGVIGPFLHSLRLHYVEFFKRFYEGGGVPYEPFGS